MKIISFLILLVFAAGCKKIDGPVNISAAANILLLDTEGNNLLTSPQKVKIEDIQLYYVNDGQAVSANNGLMNAPKGFEIIKDQNGQEFLRVYLNINDDKYPLTLIRFSESDTDTIKTEFSRNNESVLCSKIWYNEILKWDVNDRSARDEQFTVVK